MKKLIAVILSFVLMSGAVLPASAARTISLPEGNTTKFNGHTYTRYDISLSWQDAKAYCERLGGYLVTITSLEEQMAVMRLIKGGTKNQYWIGATDEEEEGVWKWITGEEWGWTYNGGFDNAYGVEDYMEIYNNNWGDGSGLGKWNDINNANTIGNETEFFSLQYVGFVCEFGGNFEHQTAVPTIYVIGRTGIVDAEGNGIINENSSFITSVVNDCKKEMVDAVFLNKWDEFIDKIYTLISAKYEKYRLNENGEVTNGSHNLWTWSEETLPTEMGNIFTYRFEYDARLDPCDIADDLHTYIEAIKAKTGYDTVNIIGRCLGGNIATAYANEYGWDDIETFILFASAAKGYDFVGEMFAGKFDFDDDAIVRYSDENLYPGTDDPMLELVRALVSYSKEIGLVDFWTLFGKAVFDRVAEGSMSDLLLATYATCPGYWAMVNDENYEQAKELIFGDEADTTYKELVRKIDYYHYNVQNNVERDLLNMKRDGVKVNVICKYGFQVTPFIESSDQIGDNRIEVSSQSLGANTAKMDETLSKKYIENAKENGTYKYISPDQQIDSSTALFPDYTWYIKNIVHNPFFDCFNLMMLEMCYNEDQMDVNTDPDYPQYLYYDADNGTVTPLTVENMETQEYTNTFLSSLKRLFERIRDFFKELFKWRLEWVKTEDEE
ncbi:MAG: hypothetical protein IJS90_07120 [Clostridia bacterium]|nr:hypothetical protein [Clostridia bacterium]